MEAGAAVTGQGKAYVLLRAVQEVLRVHGLNETCDSRPEWHGDARQVDALKALHAALIDVLARMESPQ